MDFKTAPTLLMIALTLVGCSAAPDDDDVAEQPVEQLAETADTWLGDWRGPEGLHLSVDKDAAKGPGHYILVMRYGQDDKDSGIFNGQASGDVINFSRGGRALTLRATDGQATGMKWLAGKQHCLTVEPGEGYCQD